jgi:two-component system OmpR family response regulator
LHANSTQSLKVLLVEDDVALGERVKAYAATHAIDATLVDNIAGTRMLLKQHRFDVVVLDLMLVDGDGMTLARELVAQNGPPVLITSARIEEADRVLGLELGAEDYLVKPYSFRELVARIRVVDRRNRAGAPRTRRLGRFAGWTLDLAAHALSDPGGTDVRLTEGEFALLRAFLDNPHRVLTRASLMALTDRDDARVFERTIDVLIARLRRKLASPGTDIPLLQTVRGEGYRLGVDVIWIDSADQAAIVNRA